MISKMKTGIIIILTFSVSLCCSAQNHGNPEGSNAKSKWSLSAGPIYHAGMEVKISGSSYVQQLGLHGNSLPEGGISNEVGPVDDFANRIYDDGYIFRDSQNPWEAGSQTWYWGYENSSQWDPAKGQIEFTNRGGRWNSKEIIEDRESSAEENWAGLGAGITISRNFDNPERFAGISAGFEFINLENLKISDSTFSEEYETGAYRVRDSYVFAGTPPSAPYFNNDTPGPTIPNVPVSRSTSRVITESGIASNEIEVSLGSNLSTIWFGPDISLKKSTKFNLFAQPRLSANHLSTNIKRTETFKTNHGGTENIINSWEDNEDVSEWEFGLGIAIESDIAIGEDWLVNVCVWYDGVADKTEKEIGPTKVTIDLGGYGIKLALKKGF